MIFPYSETYYTRVFLLWSYINYNTQLCYCAYYWYIVACNKVNSVCPFLNFPWQSVNESYTIFDSPFFHWSLVSSSFDCIKYLNYRIVPVSGSTNLLTMYQVNSYSSTCVVVGIVRAMLFIYFCVTICTSLENTLGGLSGFIFSVCTLGACV